MVLGYCSVLAPSVTHSPKGSKSSCSQHNSSQNCGTPREHQQARGLCTPSLQGGADREGTGTKMQPGTSHSQHSWKPSEYFKYFLRVIQNKLSKEAQEQNTTHVNAARASKIMQLAAGG